MGRPKTKPKAPRRIGSDDPGVSADTIAQPDVVMLPPERKVRDTAGYSRVDVFARLLVSPTQRPTLIAVRRLEADMLERAREGDRNPAGEKVDGASWLRDGVTARSMDAGSRVVSALALVGRRDAALLSELIQPARLYTEAREGAWRVATLLITGERGEKAQAAAVRAAADNLRLAYAEIDGGRRVT